MLNYMTLKLSTEIVCPEQWNIGQHLNILTRIPCKIRLGVNMWNSGPSNKSAHCLFLLPRKNVVG